MAGAVFLPLNTGYTRDEVGYFVGNAERRSWSSASRPTAARAAPRRTRRGAALETLEADGGGSFAEPAAGLPERVRRRSTAARTTSPRSSTPPAPPAAPRARC